MSEPDPSIATPGDVPDERRRADAGAGPAGGAPADDEPPLFQPPPWRERLELLAAGARPQPGRLAVAAAAGLAAVVAVVVVVRGPAGPAPELTIPMAGGPGDPSVTSTSTTAEAAAVVVHAAGAVVRPGVYRLPAGARVTDVLDAAGGPAPDADLDRVNLAAPAADGDRVYVPRVGEAAPPPVVGSGSSSVGGESSSRGPIDLNTASADELDELPGVGPATAQAIIDERERRGGFRSVDDLLDVRGIGDAKLAQLRDLVTV